MTKYFPEIICKHLIQSLSICCKLSYLWPPLEIDLESFVYWSNFIKILRRVLNIVRAGSGQNSVIPVECDVSE